MNSHELKMPEVMAVTLSLAAGVAIGAAGMYVLDPARGHSRRRRMRDIALSRVYRGQRKLTGLLEDAINRTKGVVAEAERVALFHTTTDDATLADRVRSKMGHVTRHARGIESSVNNGVVTLRGVLESEPERQRVVEEIAAIPGVRVLVACWSPASLA